MALLTFNATKTSWLMETQYKLGLKARITRTEKLVNMMSQIIISIAGA